MKEKRKEKRGKCKSKWEKHMLSLEICQGKKVTQGEILTYGERGGYNPSAGQTRRKDCIDSQSTHPISESGSDRCPVRGQGSKQGPSELRMPQEASQVDQQEKGGP
jgi:hypothetical protein